MPNTVLGKVSLTPKGEYDPSASYTPLDLVQYEGSGYVVLRDVQGVTPVDNNDNYMLLTAKGDKGDIGPVGPQGEQGETDSGLTVLDHYDTEEALQAAVTAPELGDAYSVGEAAPYDIYIYSKTRGWVNHGPLQGAKGDAGAAATIESVSVATGEPGTEANVSNNGTTTAAQLHFVIPRGDKGEDGYTPVKGTDYWTETDKTEMVNEVLAALPVAEGVSF